MKKKYALYVDRSNSIKKEDLEEFYELWKEMFVTKRTEMKIDFNDITELAQGTAMDVWGPREPAKLIEKLKEEVTELEEAWDYLDAEDDSSARFDVMKELGDVLFCIVRFAHNIGISPRDALALTIVKIQEREKYGIAKKKQDVATK